MSNGKAQNYTQCFGSEVGQRVLEDLQEIWRSAPGGLDQAALAHLEGQRHVVRYIEQQIQRGSKE